MDSVYECAHSEDQYVDEAYQGGGGWEGDGAGAAAVGVWGVDRGACPDGHGYVVEGKGRREG